MGKKKMDYDETLEFIQKEAQSIVDSVIKQAQSSAEKAGMGDSMLGTTIWRAVGRKLS